MGRFFNKRATVEFSESDLLTALINTEVITRAQAMEIPSVAGCVSLIAETVSSIPIKLYKEVDGKIEEIKSDRRVRLINDETGDTLNGVQFKRALIEDYLLSKGGYAYINKRQNEIVSLHYVKSSQLAINKNSDPIFKDYDILVNGQPYKPYDFLKILRNSKDGSVGTGVVDDHQQILQVAYNALKYENNLVSTGGNKKGFIKSAKKLSQEAIDALKAAWRKLYANNQENVVVLNDGLDFQESSNTSVELQLNENKKTNSAEICKLFKVPTEILDGTATHDTYINLIKVAILPVIKEIECAFNKDLLLEKEKGSFYFAADLKEIMKGDIEKRYKAYSEAVKGGWIMKNEIRYMEDMEEIDGLNVVTMSLGDVIYDVDNKTYYTPNTKMLQDSAMKGGENTNED